MITLTWESVVTLAAVVAAAVALIGRFANGVRWFDKTDSYGDEIKAIKAEQTILIDGVLACLKGLAEQGCDGPVKDAISKLETHLNTTAHGG